MAKRIILSGILGGIVLFLWQSVSHLALTLGEVGIKRVGNEEAVIAALRENIQQPGRTAAHPSLPPLSIPPPWSRGRYLRI